AVYADDSARPLAFRGGDPRAVALAKEVEPNIVVREKEYFRRRVQGIDAREIGAIEIVERRHFPLLVGATYVNGDAVLSDGVLFAETLDHRRDRRNRFQIFVGEIAVNDIIGLAMHGMRCR